MICQILSTLAMMGFSLSPSIQHGAAASRAIKWSVAIGETSSYALTIKTVSHNVNGLNGPADLTETTKIARTIKAIHANGDRVIADRESDRIYRLDGTVIPSPNPDRAITWLLDRYGAPLDVDDSSTKSGAPLWVEDTFIYPRAPVKRGDTWHAALSLEKSMPTVEVTFAYQGEDTYHGIKCLKISSKFEQREKDSLSGASLFWIRASDGSVEKVIAHAYNVEVSPGSPKVSWVETMERTG